VSFDKDQKYALAKARKGDDIISMSVARALCLIDIPAFLLSYVTQLGESFRLLE
jgi:hypothetical protein